VLAFHLKLWKLADFAYWVILANFAGKTAVSNWRHWLKDFLRYRYRVVLCVLVVLVASGYSIVATQLSGISQPANTIGQEK
jgi:small-conductance mechanosensitive channel